ncbi:unnamed protein product [Musa hybrid cultivar]
MSHMRSILEWWLKNTESRAAVEKSPMFSLYPSGSPTHMCTALWMTSSCPPALWFSLSPARTGSPMNSSASDRLCLNVFCMKQSVFGVGVLEVEDLAVLDVALVASRVVQRGCRILENGGERHAVLGVPVPEWDGEGVVVDELAEDPLVEVEVVAVPGEEDPAEVNLDGHVVGILLVVGFVAILAVDVRLLVVVPRVFCRQVLHPPHGLLVLFHILLIVLHEVGRPPHPKGRSGEVVIQGLLAVVGWAAVPEFDGNSTHSDAPGAENQGDHQLVGVLSIDVLEQRRNTQLELSLLLGALLFVPVASLLPMRQPNEAAHELAVVGSGEVTVRNGDVDVEASCLVGGHLNILDLEHLHLLLLLHLLAVLLRPCHDHPQRVARVERLGCRPEFAHPLQRQLCRGLGLRLCRLLAIYIAQPWEGNLLERVPKLGRVKAVLDLHRMGIYSRQHLTCLDFDELLVLVMEEEGAVQPVFVFELDVVAAEVAVDVPHAVYIAMVAEENRIAGGGGEVAHVFLVSVRLSDPHVRRIVDDFQLPVCLLVLLLPRVHGIPHEQLRQRQAVLERLFYEAEVLPYDLAVGCSVFGVGVLEVEDRAVLDVTLVAFRVVQRGCRILEDGGERHAVLGVPVPEGDGEGVVVDELAEDPLVEVEVVAVPGEEDPAEVDLDGHVVGILLVVGVVAILAVDVRLLVVVPRVFCRQVLHPPHGLLVLVHILLIILHEVGRSPHPEGRSGEVVLQDRLAAAVRRAAVVVEGRCVGIVALRQIRRHYRLRQNFGPCGHAVKPS